MSEKDENSEVEQKQGKERSFLKKINPSFLKNFHE